MRILSKDILNLSSRWK